ncbi:MAG TPA: hypothetical protein VGH19_21730 [Verrucomicrobiae bacterium]
MPGKFAKAVKGLFVVALIASAALAGLHYKEDAIQLWERLRAPKAAAPIEASPTASTVIDESLRRSQVSGKTAVIRFNLTGCAVCERMSRDVFAQAEWATFAAEKLELTDYLMPTSFTSAQPELVQRMELLDSFAKASGAGQGFPFVAVIAKDGSLLGARSGYQDGGPKSYIRWIEQLSKGDKSSPKKLIAPASATTKSTTSPASVATVSQTASAAKASPTTNAPPIIFEVTLKGVSGTGDRKVALIGVGKRNIPLMIGEKKKVPWENTFKVVECREIGEREVVVHIEGEAETRHLALPLK